MRTLLAAVGFLAAGGVISAQSSAVHFQGARWIWSSFGSGVALEASPAGVTYFRTAVTVPENATVRSAEVLITADNLFALYVNGHSVGECEVDNSAWRRPLLYEVTGLLVPGRNVLAVEAVNTLPGPAGLLVKLVVRLADGSELAHATGGEWKCSHQERLNWQQIDFDDALWTEARVLAEFGAAPWGKLAAPPSASETGPVSEVHQAGKRVLAQAARRGWAGPVAEVTPPADYPWPEAIVFLGDDCSLYRPAGPTGTSSDSLTVTIFNPRKSRAFPEHDLPAPMKIGRKLYSLRPARPGVRPRTLLDAGRGAIGSPSVSFDGKSIYVSMVREGESFFHIHRLPAEGGPPERLTHGPFHDIDPVELPDGRIAFSSTRIGTFEEYHNAPSRALFVMNADGSAVQPLTHTIIFDNEPEVLADGRIILIRSDNFFDRGKVETRLHAIYPDGTAGHTEFGLENGPEYGGRLRAFFCGSPAPMPDGGLAFVSSPGITVGHPGAKDEELRHFRLGAGDVAALPDGRLLCTIASRVSTEVTAGKTRRTVRDIVYQRIGLLEPNNRPASVVLLHESRDGPLHSPVYLGASRRPPALPSRVSREKAGDARATGFFLCENARFTRNTTAGWPHVRAMRVLAGKGLTTRSSHSYIVHGGSEVIELGTVPLAADGSFFVEVPADTPIAFQAVDAEGRSELNEMSWIYVRPGERRGCVGCHQPRQVTPAATGSRPLATKSPPLRLLGQGRPHRFRGNNAAVTGLMELQFDRFREVAGINRHGAASDPLATGATDVAALVGQLGEKEAGLRMSAAQRLAIFRDPAAAGALAEALKDDVREVRVAAAVSLAACGTRESIEPLLEALTDWAPLVAQAAAMALENLTGHAEPFDAFAPRVERYRQAESWRRWFAKITWGDIERELIRRLNSSDRGVVRRAAVALGHTGSHAAHGALRHYVALEGENNPFPAWRATGHRGDAARFNALAAVNPRTLQAATRSLGFLRDAGAVTLLAAILRRHDRPDTANLFLAEAAVEALGRVGTPAAEAALVAAFRELEDYPKYTYWYGDHEALMACHASPVHYFIAEALDAMGSTRARTIVPDLIRSVPTDPDRALLMPNDDCETLTGRIIRRNGAEADVVETCLAILGDSRAERHREIAAAIRSTHRAWGGDPGPEIRAAQILSLACRDRRYEPRVRAAFNRFRRKQTTIPRVFDTGIPVVLELPIKHWVCFYLARALGNLADPRSADTLIEVLGKEPTEAAPGRPDPLGPGVLFLHNDLTPCWRAAVAWALGRIGHHRAVDVLLAVVADLDNAIDTRHAAAEALARIGTPSSLEPIRRLARDYPEISTRRVLLEACESLSKTERPPTRRRRAR